MNIDFNALTDREYYNLESKLRRKLGKQGYSLRKGKNIYNFSGYMIVDAESNLCVAGYTPTVYSFDISDVAHFT